MPMLTDRTLMVIVSKADDQHLTLSVVPKRMKDGENAALMTPLCCTGTPEELDRDLPGHLRDFVAGQLAFAQPRACLACRGAPKIYGARPLDRQKHTLQVMDTHQPQACSTRRR
jgi:hypothetical protein